MFLKRTGLPLGGFLYSFVFATALCLISPFLAAQEGISEPAEINPETETQYKAAFGKFQRSDVAGALDDLRRIAANDPKMIPPRLILAQWYTNLKNPSAVRLSLEKAVEESPDDPEAYILLAENGLRQGEWAAADLLLRRAEELLNDGRVWANPSRKDRLAVLQLKNDVVLNQARENWREMQRCLGELWKRGEKTPETCRLIGVSYFHLGEPAKARQWFAQAHKMSPETEFSADLMMARLGLATGDRAAAQEALEAARKNEPDAPEVLNLSLVIALDAGEMNRVKALADKLESADPANPATLKTCGIASLYLEDYPRAEALFTEALRLQPGNPEMVNGLVLALCEQNDAEKTRQAVRHATENLQRQGRNPEYMATLGWALYKAGQREQALSLLQQSAAEGRLSSQTAYYLAEVLRAGGQTDDARELLNASVSGGAPFTKQAAAQNLLRHLK